jgi:hypothetical protein
VRNSRKSLQISRVKTRKNEQALGQGSNSFHPSVPQNAAENHVVKVGTQQGAPAIQATILGTQKSFIVHTGSNVSLIKPDVSHNRIRTTNLASFGVTGHDLEFAGVQEVEFWCNNRKYCHQFSVCSLPTDADGIIGKDFLPVVNAKLDLEKQQLRMLKCKNFDHTLRTREREGLAEWPTALPSRYSLLQTAMRTGKRLRQAKRCRESSIRKISTVLAYRKEDPGC